MADQPRAYYPWELELFAMSEERKAKGIVPQPRLASTIPPAKLSHVIQFIQEAYARPEIWGEFVIINDQLEVGTIKQDDIDNGWCDEVGTASELLSQFGFWYRMKNNLDECGIPYAGGFRILKEIAHRRCSADTETIKSMFDSMTEIHGFIDYNN